MLDDTVVNSGGNCLHGAVQGSIPPKAGRDGLWLHVEVREGEEWGACPLRSKFCLSLPTFQVGRGRCPLGDLFSQSAAPDATCVGGGVEADGFLRTSTGSRGADGRGGGRVGQDAWRRGQVEAIKD